MHKCWTRIKKMATLSLHTCRVQQPHATINRIHIFLHFTAILFLLYYRTTRLFLEKNVPTLAWSLISISELILTIIWILIQAFRWHPVSRSAIPENIPGGIELPGLDVFVCTLDPKKEPTIEVMNTVLSALALDYPPEKLSVYLSDDGGSYITLYAIKEACSFAKSWLPFCKKYGIKSRCPRAYFSSFADDERLLCSDEFRIEEQKIKAKYDEFKGKVEKVGGEDENNKVVPDRAPRVEIIHDNKNNEENVENQTQMPLLVYVSRERRPSCPHRFKAGALNTLLRVSGVISNGPYLLVLDCDMYCNDPTSARQAMCFHLDSQLSHSLAFVQFPQVFYNISKNDIYDGQTRTAYKIGFSYDCLLESAFTGYLLHCKGWISVYLYPKRPCFLGCTTIDMKDGMVQLMKWNSNLLQVGLSKFSPLIYGVSRMSVLQSMCYGYLTCQSFLSVGLLLYGTVPQVCLLNGIPLYPKVSDPWFAVFVAIYTSSLFQHLYEVLSSDGSIMTWWNEQRIWIIRLVSGSLFAVLDAIMKCLSKKKVNISLTNKAVDKEKFEKYEKGKFDFEGAAMFMVPLLILVILNIVCFFCGLRRVVIEKSLEEMFGQVFLSFFVLILSYPILEGMVTKVMGK
ncbi:cellulose synthase-like protein g1 [Quercus suber]|uniref:Cellulose synthase-like protein g1 n=1 Tax=Quercus suber TaxID=58331 RepID=A0AAW0KU40_QUESU